MSRLEREGSQRHGAPQQPFTQGATRSNERTNMKLDKLYHKCGHPILVVHRPIGPAVETFFVDGNRSFIQSKDGSQKPNVIERCPECSGTIKIERLVSVKPVEVEQKGASGYMPARFTPAAP